MNYPHQQIIDGEAQSCDGDMIDIGTLVAPNRYLCTKCRTVKVLAPGWDEEPMPPPAGKDPGILRRAWNGLLEALGL